MNTINTTRGRGGKLLIETQQPASFSPKEILSDANIAGGLFLAAAAALFAAPLLSEMNYQDKAASVPVAMESMKASMIAHAQGVESALIINGVVVPPELSERLADMVTSEISAEVEAALELRHAGLEEGLEGNWSSNRLWSYLDRIDSFDPSVTDMIQHATSTLSDAGINPERAEMLVKVHVASELLGGESRLNRPLQQGMNAEAYQRETTFYDTIGELRTSLANVLSDIETVGQINRSIMVDLALGAINENETKNPSVEVENGPQL